VTVAARPGPTTRVPLRAVDGHRVVNRRDVVATEEPMEIRLAAGRARRRLAITMRTPGADFELAAGFLHSEGVIRADDVRRIAYCTDTDLAADQRYNVVTVTLSGDRLPELITLERHFTTSSACGVCGKSSLDGLHLHGAIAAPPGPTVESSVIEGLPTALRKGQRLFAATGGLHAAGLFTADGTLACVREDVGRHNAVDKVVGWAQLSGRLPLHDHILMVSGRSSYEIMQKALAAGIPIVCAVSAPSSLAVELAIEYGMTLIGFLRGQRFNVYVGAERIQLPAAVPAPASPTRGPSSPPEVSP
jgi:FdhD protein